MGSILDGLYDTVSGVVRRGRQILRTLTPSEVAALVEALQQRERGEIEDDAVVAAAPETARAWLRDTMAKVGKKWWVPIVISILLWLLSDHSSEESTQSNKSAAAHSTQVMQQDIQRLSERDQQLQQLVQQMLNENDDERRTRPTTSAPALRQAKLGGNEPCWCGSGRKFKHCHLTNQSPSTRRSDR